MAGRGMHMTRQSRSQSATRRALVTLRWTAALFLAFALAACNSGPQGEQAVVEGTVHVCSSCHGLDGRSISPTFPNLAGQQNDYITAQLEAFRDHTRADPHAHTYMWGMAATLTDATIEGIAKYYSSQAPAPGTPGDPSLVAAGKKIFHEGIPDRDIPVCANCHGEKAQGDGAFPRLAGQHPSYIESQLLNFQTLARNNELMHENSLHLSPSEIHEVAAYVGSL
jgi:cytochrome c553